MEKITKREFYTALINYANGNGMVFAVEDKDEEGAMTNVTVSAEDLKVFAENEIALLDKKAEKARENAKKKRKEADALQFALQEVLTDEFEPIAAIAAKLNDEDATVAKCVYRLNALVEAGVAEKADIKVEDAAGKKRTVKGYKLAGEVEADPVE